jgi:DNA-binding transcriptional ArsR family regulator
MTTEDVWYDDEAGPLVRLYAITGGRSEAPAGDFTLSAIVQAVPGAPIGEGELTLERSTIVQLAERPVSVSEIAARLGLPLGSVRVILSDLRDAGLIAVPRGRDAGERPSMQLLEQVLSGLNSL